MQYSIPQFIDREQKLLGPLTVRQTLILGLTAIILVVAFFLLKLNFFVFTLLAVAVGSLGLGISFIKINDKPLYFIFTAFLEYFINPKRYLWQKQNNQITLEAPQSSIIQEKAKTKLKKVTEKDIESLAEFLDQ